jgi:hypothetical protein
MQRPVPADVIDRPDADSETLPTTPQRIGVLTFHRCINYGSYWQARCLVEGLRSRGHDAVILNHFDAAVNVAEWRCALRPTLPNPVPTEDVAQYACKTRKVLAEVENLPLSQTFDLDDPESLGDLDTLVIGSDEVWNLKHPWYSAKPAFFGEGIRAQRVVTYAASFGNYSCWEGIGPPWTDFLRRIDAISVRDENSWWMLKNCLGKEVDIVLDPCLQWPPICQPMSGAPYAVVYGHGFSREFADGVRAWARSRDLRLLSVGYRNEWADAQWLTASAMDFARAMAGAAAIATNFFHGCVFSLLNAKPFACERSQYRSIKINGLMELLGSEFHLWDRGDVHALLNEPPRRAIVSKIEQLRTFSNAYLDRAVGVSCARQP